MAQWISVDRDTLRLADEECEISGIRVRLSTSPYDVPTAFRGYFDHELDRFVIEFRYIEHEESVLKRHDPVTEFKAGILTGRVQAIIIDVKKIQAQAVGIEFEKRDWEHSVQEGIAIASRVLSGDDGWSRQNADAANAILNTQSDKLVVSPRNR